MKQLKNWIQASRLASQAYIFLPILMGQAYWFFLGDAIDWRAFIVIQMFGLFDQLYIVYANDYADYRDDRRNTMPTMFSGGSRVLVDNLLQPKDLKSAAIFMAVLCGACGVFFTIVYHYALMIPLMTVGLLLLWMYSYPPFKMSYRGGGELLQTAGTAVLLPLLGYYAQSGSINAFPWMLLFVIAPTSLACAIATAVPDEPADRAYRKRTIAVLVGLPLSKSIIILLNAASIIMYYCIGQHLKSDVLDIIVHVLPVAALVGSISFVKSRPGTAGIMLFGLMAILTTISLVGGMSLGFFGY